MPVNRDRYPADWEKISLDVKQSQNWRCKWCDVRHGAVGFREEDGRFRCVRTNAQKKAAIANGRKLITIVLTTAHLGTPKADGTPGDKHDKMDVRKENLAALCQRCHLRFDIEEHKLNAARTRLEKKARKQPLLPDFPTEALLATLPRTMPQIYRGSFQPLREGIGLGDRPVVSEAIPSQ